MALLKRCFRTWGSRSHMEERYVYSWARSEGLHQQKPRTSLWNMQGHGMAKKEKTEDPGWQQRGKVENVFKIRGYMGKLEKWYRWTHLQGKNRDIDTERMCGCGGGWNGGMTWEVGIDIYTFLIFGKLVSTLAASIQATVRWETKLVMGLEGKDDKNVCIT